MSLPPLTMQISESLTAALAWLTDENPPPIRFDLPALKTRLDSLSPFKAKCGFLVLLNAQDQRTYFLMFDPMHSVIAAAAVDTDVPEDAMFSADFEQFQAATKDATHVELTASSVTILTKRSTATLMQAELIPASLRRLALTLDHDPEADGAAIPSALWPMIRQQLGPLAMQSYMATSKRKLDMYVSQQKGSLVMAVADDYHQAISVVPTTHALTKNVRLPQHALDHIAKLFNLSLDDSSKDDVAAEAQQIQISQNERGIFFIGANTMLYVPQSREISEMFTETFAVYEHVTGVDPVAYADVPASELREALSFVTKLCGSERVACEIVIAGSKLRLSKFAKSGSGSGGSFEIVPADFENPDDGVKLSAKGNAKERIDPRLLKETLPLIKGKAYSRVCLHGPDAMNLLVIDTTDDGTGARTVYMLPTKEKRDAA